MQYRMHREDNDVKILVAKINSIAEEQRFELFSNDTLTKEQEFELEKQKLSEASKQFEAKLKLEEKKHNDEIAIKEKQLRQKGGKNGK